MRPGYLGSAGLIALGRLSVGAPDPVMVLLFGPLIFALGSMTTMPKLDRVWTSRPMVWLGEVSFAVYMVCIPWMLVRCPQGRREGPAPVRRHRALAGLPGRHVPSWSVPVAGLAHHLVERPARAASCARLEARLSKTNAPGPHPLRPATKPRTRRAWTR